MTFSVIGYFGCSKMHALKCDNFTYYVSPSPDSSNVIHYKDLLLKNRIDVVVRLCEKRYDATLLTDHDITVIDMFLDDGLSPSANFVAEWIKLISNEKKKQSRGIAIHCLSGLGRSPLMTCIAMIKIEKINSDKSIIMMRKCIEKSLNTHQLRYLYSLDKKSGCCIM